MRKLPIALLITTFCCMLPAAFAQQACFRTSTKMQAACNLDVFDDYLVAQAGCLNLADAGEAHACNADARRELRDARGQCFAQRKARNELCNLLSTQGPYDPLIDPADYVSPEAAAANPNPFLPLVPGVTRIYEAEDETIMVTVMAETKEILGVTCTVVLDEVVDEEGQLVESTFDWYAQDIAGNVWYFGEISKNFEDGELTDIEGSWLAGSEGAKPGIVMPAAPSVGATFRQEFALGEAEDAAEVLSIVGEENSPAAACNGACLITRDFTPLEPGVSEHKYYAPGVGLILEIDPETGDRLELVEIAN